MLLCYDKYTDADKYSGNVEQGLGRSFTYRITIAWSLLLRQDITICWYAVVQLYMWTAKKATLFSIFDIGHLEQDC